MKATEQTTTTNPAPHLNGATPPRSRKTRKKPLRLTTGARRKRIEAIVENLLALMDEADGDPDEEPSTSEATHLGVPSGAWDEHEPDEADYEPDEGDWEPSLGWTDCQARGRYADLPGGQISGSDLEDEHDGREPQGDEEPNDNGIADEGGLQDQWGSAL